LKWIIIIIKKKKNQQFHTSNIAYVMVEPALKNINIKQTKNFTYVVMQNSLKKGEKKIK